MKAFIIVLFCAALGGCTYHIYRGTTPIQVYKKNNNLPQTAQEVQAQRIWGASNIKPIGGGIRNIPESAKREAKCNQGLTQYCDYRD